MKKIILGLCTMALLASCGSKKKIAELEDTNQKIKDSLETATAKLNSSLAEKEDYKKQIEFLKKKNENLMNNPTPVSSSTSATPCPKVGKDFSKYIENMREKNLAGKDSATLALVKSLKGALGDVNDNDIEINVEKGVVFISISDKLLFESGRYQVTKKAKEILGKVVKVINDKSDFDFMVEGHTDNMPIKNNMFEDNWDLSVKRATSVIRILQNEYKIDPKRITAAGRSEYMPLFPNTSVENKAKNRRTRILVLPKIDQFYDMIEKEMKNQKD